MKNIIFDFGGVLLNIDYNLTVEAFKKLGVKDFDNVFTQFHQSSMAKDYEKGKISDDEFRSYIRKHSGLDIRNIEIDAAWNAMLLDLPPQRIEMLLDLKKHYKLFLLSNTNSIHYIEYQRKVNELIYPKEFNSLFDKAYYSFRVGMRKPDADIYELVLKENNLKSDETLFIDDSPVNIEPAKKLGMAVYDFPQMKIYLL